VIGLEEAAEAIRAGRVVVVPTDTVYGLACDPANPEAVEAVYVVKDRPAHLELNLLAADISQLDDVVVMDGGARSLAARFWPGALAMVCPVGRRRLAIPRRGAALMVRVPAHDLLRRLLRLAGPVASTSANPHGRPPALTAAEAERLVGDRCAGVLDGGPGAGRASTIIDLTSTFPRVLRVGPIPASVLAPHLGPVLWTADEGGLT
jgi:L-threonylcarbamoyladenylate synthase